MRVAQIGDDGKIYDAEGKVYGLGKAKGRGLGQYPQMKQYARRSNPRPVEWTPRTYTDSPIKQKTSYNPHENTSWYLRGLSGFQVQMLSNRVNRPITLGQFNPPDVPITCLAPQGGGGAYKLAKSTAVPLAGFAFTRTEGNPDKNVYPRRFVISERFPDILFRVAYRAPSSPSSVKLLTLQGQGAGNYIEVPIQKDGSPNPALLDDFYVVPASCEWAVENSFVNPLPIFGNGKDSDAIKITINYITSAIEQASYNMLSANITGDPAGFQQSVLDSLAVIMSAVGLAIIGVDMTAASYDFEVIGKKEFNIIFRVATSVYEKAVGLYAMVDPNDPKSLFNVNDPVKIAAFGKAVAEASLLTPYWSSMLARAYLYYQQSMFYKVMGSISLFSSTAENLGELNAMLGRNKDLFISSVTGKDEPGKGPITTQRANGLFIELQKQIVTQFKANNQNGADYISIIQTNVFPGINLDDLPLFFFSYDQMLKENAQSCLKARSYARGVSSVNVPECFDGLGAAAASLPGGGGATSGVDFRKEEKEILKVGFLKWITDHAKEKKVSMLTAAADLGAQLDATILRVVQDEGLAAKDLEKINKASEIIMNRDVALKGAKTDKEIKAINDQYQVRGANFMRDALETFTARFGQDIANLRSLKKTKDVVPAVENIATNMLESLSIEDTDPKGNKVRRYIAGLMFPKEVDAIGGKAPQGITKEPEPGAGFSARTFLNFVDAVMSAKILTEPGEWAKVYKRFAEDFGMTDVNVLKDQLEKEQRALQKSLAGLGGEGELEKIQAAQDGKNPDGTPYVEGRYIVSKRLQDKIAKRTQAIAVIKMSLDVPSVGAPVATQLQDKAQELQQLIESTGISKLDSKTQLQLGLMLDTASELIKSSRKIVDDYGKTKENEKAIAEFDSDPDNIENMRKFKLVLSSAEAAKKAIESVLTSFKADKPEDIKVVQQYAKAFTDAVTDLDLMNEKVAPVWARISTWTRIKDAIKTVWLKGWEVISGKAWIPVASKSRVISTVLGLFNLTAALSVVAVPFYLALGIPLKYLPFPLVLDFLVKLKNWIPSKGIEDGSTLPGEEAKGGASTVDPIWKFVLLSLGISAIFFGDKLFPAFGAAFNAVNRAIENLTKVLIPKKGAGHGRGRPPMEKKVIGRGRPTDINEVARALKEAQAGGDAKEEARLKAKIERAAERGQAIPPGLIGFLLR
jgi:hypothetical protein